MKKLFTLVGAFALAIGLAAAQPAARKISAPHTNGLLSSAAVTAHKPYYFSRNDRDLAIRRVNVRYRSEVSRIQQARFMRPSVKREKMQGLKLWRNREIRQIDSRFNSRMNRYHQSRSRSYKHRH